MPASPPAIDRDPAGTPAHVHPVRELRPFLLAFAVLFAITYFEPLNIFGFKFATIWRLLIVIPAVALIASRPFAPDAPVRALEPLFWASMAFTLAPLLSIGGEQSSFRVAIETCAQRGFPIIVLLLVVSTSRIDWADLLVRAFPLYLCLVSVPVLLGWIDSTGDSLKAVAGVSVSAYASVFQNLHSAALAHAIAGLCAFALLVRFPGKYTVPLLLVVLVCVVLTTITTARSGLLALVVGMIAIAALMRQMKLFLILAALAVLLGLIVGLARPELIDVATNRLLGRNMYVLDHSADAMSSGRLTLQMAAMQAYADQSLLDQLFGIGRTASMEAIGRYSGLYLIAHNAFVDELIAHGAVGLAALIAVLAAAARLAWSNARAGHPAGFALVLALLVYALFQGIDYSLQLSIIGMVLLLETRARFREGSGT